jgi:hypothetical protein
VKNKDQVRELVDCPFPMEDLWMMKTDVEVVTDETRIQVVEISLVHVGPRWSESQPAPVCQVPLMWYLDQALAPV